jgi:hypothetical protein
MISVPLLLLLVVPAEEPIKPKFPLGKETTYVSGPLDKDGYVDYAAALNERLGKGVTPQTNANVLIWKALGPRPEGGDRMPLEYFKLLGTDEPPANGDYFIGLGAFIKDRLKLDPAHAEGVYDLQSRAAKRPWAAKDFPQISAWLAVNEQPLAVVIEASKRPAYFNPLVPKRAGTEPGLLIGALLPSAQKCREITVALCARAMLRTAEGKYDDAWEDLLASHRLARLVGNGATNIEALIGIALNATACNADLAYVGNARLTSRQVQARLADLQKLPPMPAIADKIDLGERFIYLDAMQSIHRGMFEQVAGGPGKLPDPQALKALETIDFVPSLRKANSIYDRIAIAMRVPERDRKNKELMKIEDELELEAAKKKADGTKLGQINRILEIMRKPADTGKMVGNSIGDTALGMMMPAVLKVQNAYDRCDQNQQNVKVAFALAAYRADTGRYPAKLDDLAPKYLSAVRNDLFSGQPLIYRRTEKGYLLYSVGVNGVDDGGQLFTDDPPGDDIGVRMPLPDLKPKK